MFARSCYDSYCTLISTGIVAKIMVVILRTSVHMLAADNGYARDYDDDPHCCDSHEMSTFMSVCNRDNVNDGQ